MTLAFDLGFGLIPVWGSMLICRLFRVPVPWENYFVHGELAIYAAALLGPSLNRLWHSRGKPPISHGRGFLLVGVLGLLISAFMFAATVTGSRIAPDTRLDEPFLAQSSVVLFLFAVLFVLIIGVVDNVRMALDVPGTAEADLVTLSEKLHGLDK